tara:strand:- start:464 stop:847 length:384 start_codon:yes stop_codon:yes gene_type:complete
MSNVRNWLAIGEDIARVVKDDDGIYYIDLCLKKDAMHMSNHFDCRLWIGAIQRDAQHELLGQDKDYLDCQYKMSSFYMHRKDAVASLIQEEKRFLLGYERRSKHSDASRERLAHLEQVLEKELKEVK